jgi:molecular chaperone DnaK
MSEMINFGIDLGTTNSVIAKCNKGTVEVFKNPSGFKETLPSVVGFRDDRILVGETARRYIERDPKNVVGRFKRKMGTTESYKLQAHSQSKTPVELSAFVLKELKTFIRTSEAPEAVVITIPASFDMVQSNATKEAGHAAGFKQVVLLQEPIAASLAYANKERNLDLKDSQWMVYDLGGGTFDVALVKIVEGELKIMDHEGDNYLGGADFDALIVEKLIVPQLQKRGTFTDLLTQMKSETGRYNKLWSSLLFSAEEAKIELSTRSSAEIDLTRSNIEDSSGKVINDYVTITRSEYEALIKDEIDRTAEMLKRILTRNSLRPQDLQFVLMVGGSTYTPFVRKRIEEMLGIPANTGIDPTNAIAIGAAYYAGTKEVNLGEKSVKQVQPGAIRIKVAYNRTSQEHEEMFSAKVEGHAAGLFYRITREDGGYDSGLKALTSRITEDLPLQANAYNLFAFKIYDRRNNHVPADVAPIQIAQGVYSVAGQPLPEDLCLVIDDLDTKMDQNNYDTKLDNIFAKNCVLPARAKRTKEVSKTILLGSEDGIKIIIVEGPGNHFTVNKKVGYLAISGKQLKRDLHRGMEIDLAFEVSESRDLTVRAYVNATGQEFSQIFAPTNRDVPVELLSDEVQMLEARLEQEQAEAIESENYELADKLKRLCGPVKKLCDEAVPLQVGDVTDDRYKLDDRKRKIAQDLNDLTSDKRLERLRADYQEAKADVSKIVNESGNDHERLLLKEVVTREHTFLVSKTSQKLEDAIRQLRVISYGILRRTPAFLIGWFEYLVEKRETFNDQLQSKNLIEAGKRHVAALDYEKLSEVNERLLSLLPQREQEDKEMRHFVGLR